jgi:hypothetical protein
MNTLSHDGCSGRQHHAIIKFQGLEQRFLDSHNDHPGIRFRNPCHLYPCYNRAVIGVGLETSLKGPKLWLLFTIFVTWLFTVLISTFFTPLAYYTLRIFILLLVEIKECLCAEILTFGMFDGPWVCGFHGNRKIC